MAKTPLDKYMEKVIENLKKEHPDLAPVLGQPINKKHYGWTFEILERPPYR